MTEMRTNEQIKGILDNIDTEDKGITFFQTPIRNLDLPQEYWIKMIELILGSIRIQGGFGLGLWGKAERTEG